LNKVLSRQISIIIATLSLLIPTSVWAEDPPDPASTDVSGAEIVSRCDNKYPGEDQQSQLSITLKDRNGNERKQVYLRLWKDKKGENQILDKMVLFTVFPPDAKGAAFMRWAYNKEAQKNAEQWIYLPVLRKIRRVSVRDLADSFLGSDLTYGDISYRGVEEDEHKLIRIDKDQKGNHYYVVQSKPKEDDYQYNKRVSWYKQAETWDECVKVRVDYFDKKNAFLKRQQISWQKVGPAWVWDKVLVQNGQTFHSSFFEVEKVKINEGISEDWFTERRLRQGIN
jgi:hypothetical protein